MKRGRRKKRLAQEDLDIQWLFKKYPHIPKEDLKVHYRLAFEGYQRIPPVAHFASVLAISVVHKEFGG